MRWNSSIEGVLCPLRRRSARLVSWAWRKRWGQLTILGAATGPFCSGTTGSLCFFFAGTATLADVFLTGAAVLAGGGDGGGAALVGGGDGGGGGGGGGLASCFCC